MSESTFTFRVDEELKIQFSLAAKNKDRNVAQLLRDFMRDFVCQHQKDAEYEVWFRSQVQTGQASANTGHLVPGEEVEAKFAARKMKTRRKVAAHS